MASKRPFKEKTYEISVPLVFKKRKKGRLEEVSLDDYNTIVKELDPHRLNNFFSGTLSFIEITAISPINTCELTLSLLVKSKDQLQKVFEAAKELKDGVQNELSRFIKCYCYSKSFDKQLGYDINEELCAFVKMNKTQFDEGMAALDKDAETTQLEGIQTRSSDETGRDIQGPKEVSKVDKRLVLHVPASHEYPHISNVKLVSTYRCLNGKTLKRYRKEKNMFEITLKLHCEEMSRMVYSYEIKEYKGWLTSNTYNTRQFSFNDQSCQRDVIEKYAYECVENHLEDILFFSGSNPVNIEESVSEIDTLLHKRKTQFQMEAKPDLFKSLLDKQLNRPTFSSGLLLLVVVGNLVKDIQNLKQMGVFNEKRSLTMLQALTKFRLKQLPQSCQEYMVSICLVLSQIYLGKKYCMLYFMDNCHPFLESSHYSSAFLKQLKSGEKLDLVGPNKIALTPQHEQLCISLCSTCVSEQHSLNDEQRQLLTKIVTHMPVNVALQIASIISKTFQSSEDSIVVLCKQEISEIITYKVEEKLTYIRSDLTKSIPRLLELWKNIITSGMKMKADSVETAFLYSLSGSKNKVIEDSVELIKEFLHDATLFGGDANQLELFQIISSSECKFLHETFMECASLNKFRVEFDKQKGRLCMTWITRAVTSHVTFYTPSNRSPVFRPYFVLSKLLTVESIHTDEGIKSELFEYVFKQIEKISLPSILNMTDETESELHPMVLDAFKGHLSAIVKRKLHLQQPEEILTQICSDRRLVLNSRTTARTVCIILDDALCFNELQNRDAFAAFSHIDKHRKSWKMILKADGNSIDVVRGNSNFKSATECLKMIKQKLDEQEITYLFLKTYMDKNILEDISDLFISCSSVPSKQSWLVSYKIFEQRLKDMDLIKSCLSHIKKYAPEQGLRDGIEEMIELVKRFENDLMNVLCVKDLKEEKLPRKVRCILSKSILLHDVIHSKLFWNISLKKILSEFAKVDKSLTDKYNEGKIKSEVEIIESVPVLSDVCSESYVPSDDQEANVDRVIAFFDIVLEFGCEAYKSEWNALMTDSDFSMDRWLVMFGNADIITEIETAEKYFRRKVVYEIKVILERLHNLKIIERSVKAIKSCMLSCKIKDEHVSKAVESFNLLHSGLCPNYSFLRVGELLAIVFSIADPSHEETILVLSSLGNASTLIDFLRTIAGEDIRSLIDAVDDISEQHVQESTVSALIEVKSFLHPILNCAKPMNARLLFEIIDEQVKSNVKMHERIDDCMNNLHSLKSLYNNAANRSEHTKEIIINVIKKGTFCFTLNEKGTDCEFKASYKTEKLENSHSKAGLSDLRSRALLLMNKYQMQAGFEKIYFESFVSYVDLCIEIAELVVMLHTTGHIEYKSYSNTGKGKSLLDLKTCLQSEYRDWCEKLTKIRQKYYLVSFLQGCHIHKLHTYLDIDLDMKALTQSEMEVQTLLKIIHPKIQSDTLRQQYLKRKTEEVKKDKYSFMECIGSALHFCNDDHALFERDLKSKSVEPRKLGDVVQKGRILLAQLEEFSPLVTRTVVTLFSNTVHRLPEPNQVLFCTRETTLAEIELLIFRCLGAFDFFKKPVLYCIANVELLPNEVQFKVVEALKNIEPNLNFHLAVICCGSRNHPFIYKLSDCINKLRPLTDNVIESIFQSECPNVLTVTSETAGLGKTTRITQEAFKSGRSIASLHISGPMTKERIVTGLASLGLKKYNTLHIDIGSTTSTAEIDTLLFELIVMGFVSTGKTSVYLPTSCISIEIANSVQDLLRKSLQTAMLFRRLKIVWKDYENLEVSREINSPVQVVCHFLRNLERNVIDSVDFFLTGPHCVKQLSRSVCRKLLRKYYPTFPGISFSILNIFLCVVADQLKKMSSSSFFRTSQIKDMVGHQSIPTIKSSLVKALLKVSLDFSRRSVKECRETHLSTTHPVSDGMEYSAKVIANQFEGMVRWKDSNHLMYIFHNQNKQTLSAIYRDKSKVPVNIKTLFESQMKKNLPDYMKMGQNELQTALQKICRTNPMMLEKEKLQGMSNSYALTLDNFLKMSLIILRVKSSIPVLVMGETGCGKTSLIRYLADICEVQLHVLNIHGGVNEEMISEKITTCNIQALENPSVEHWLFFDEVNTSEYVGMVSDIICHQSFLGARLAPNLVTMGACNPYKLRSASAIVTAGLKGKVHTDQLSRLVYRVLPLPKMLVDYVWDFGSLNVADEEVYIERMIETVFSVNDPDHKLFAELLTMSQSFVKNHDAISCIVSLRDVHRCKILTGWFLDNLQKKKLKKSYFAYDKTNYTERAIILGLAHCYYSRIAVMSLRKKYREEMARICQDNYRNLSECDIGEVITGEQEDILNRMILPPGTAKNTALKENVFVILVCILNKIPIFVVGNPGCSKSLSMQVIRNNLRGADSKDEFFKTLPQLYCVSFQGSESSTSDGIVKVFEKAERYQETNKADSVLSVVILDEIGLAEISQFNPLKVLHNLLEPDGKDRPDVAVVGISNWSLDASKMNRVIHLSRPDMDEQELYETGKSISDSFVNKDDPELRSKLNRRLQVTPDFPTSLIDSDLKNIAESYYQYTNQLTFKNFHGLRDFYSLIKFFSKKVARNPEMSTKEKKEIMIRGLERNFGGLPDERQMLLSEFKVEEFKHACPVKDLIRENVEDHSARHLMLVTSGESVMGVIEKCLDDAGRKNRELIIGSQFEEDLTDEYNYRILNRIILCMEQGLVLILKDLENIYGSLYDMLNQNYTVLGKKKNCRVALGPYSNPICHVADTFRCIVVVSDTKIHKSDPPFLNRFEKQCLRFVHIVTQDQRKIIKNLEKWVKAFSNCGDFNEYDSFPVYSKDMTTSLVLRKSYTYSNTDKLLRECQKELLWVTWPEVIIRLKENKWQDNLYQAEEIKDIYLKLPLHHGIKEYLTSVLSSENSNLDCQMVIVFTKSNIHSKVPQTISGYVILIEKLGTFKSEKQLFAHIQTFWLDSSSDILLLQCSAVDDEKHIMLAKTLIEKLKQEFVANKCAQKKKMKHVFLIIHIDGNKGKSNVLSQINFMGCWKLVALDTLDKQKNDLKTFLGKSLYDAIMLRKPLGNFIREQLFWAFTRIKYEQSGRDVAKLTCIMRKIRDSEQFLGLLEELIINEWIVKHCPDIYDTIWLAKVASNKRSLQTSSSFIDALEGYISNVIGIPMIKVLFVLEKQNMIETFFVQDKYSEDRIAVWKALVSHEPQFYIKDIPDNSGPESYICNTHMIELKMPFSMYVFENVEETLDEFIFSVNLLKSKCDIDLEDELPKELLKEMQKKQKLIVHQKLPRLVQYDYSSAASDYLDDFCTLKSMQICPGPIQKDVIKYMKHVVREKMSCSEKNLLEVVTSLHIAFWNYSSLMTFQLQLFFICKDIFTEKDLKSLMLGFEEKQNSSQTDSAQDHQELSSSSPNNTNENLEEISGLGANLHRDRSYDGLPTANDTEDHSDTSKNTEQIIVQLVCEKMLPTEKTLKYYQCLNEWSIKADSVLALVVKVNPNSDLIHHLRICSDIVSSLVIPFHLNSQMISNVAHLLLTENLASSAVYKALKDVIDHAPMEASSAGHSILSTYFARCIFITKTTIVLHPLFDLMCSNTLMCRYMSVYKPVLSLAFQLEEMCKLRILKDGIHGIGNGTEREEMDENNVTNTSFYLKLDSTICKLVQSEHQECPFIVMLVDIVEDIFIRSFRECKEGYGDDEIVSYLVSSHYTLTKNTGTCFDLQHVFAAGFFKACTHHVFADKALEHGEVFPKCREYIKALYKSDKTVVGKTLKGYIMKAMAFEKTSNETLKQLCELKNIFPDFDEIYLSLQDALRRNSFDMCLTGINIDESKQNLLKAFMEHEHSEFKGSMKVVGMERRNVCLSILVSYCEMKFYMPRSHTVPNDHIKSLSQCFIEPWVSSSISESSKNFLRCLAGTKDFTVTYMNHSEQTSMSDYLLNRFLVSLLAVCLMQEEENAKTSFFMNCVFGRNRLECESFPGSNKTGYHLDNYLWASLNDQMGVFTCKCKNRMAVPLSTEESFVCRECTSHIHQFQKGFESKIVFNIKDKMSSLYSTQNLSPLACQVVNLITKCCFLASLAIKTSVPEQLQSIFDCSAIDVQYNLWRETKIHWENIGKLLGVGENTTGIFLHTALNQLKRIMFENCPPMKTTEERLTWESDFNSRLQDVHKERATLQCKLFEHIRALRGEANELEDALLETGTGKDEPLATIFRRKGISSYHNFVTELHQQYNTFPLLIIVIQYIDRLMLPCHIKPIIQWHMAVVSSANYIMRKQACLNMTVSEFTQHIDNTQKKTGTLQKRFQAMIKSWNFIKKNIQDDISKEMVQFHFNLKMESCIMSTDDCIMYRVLDHLVQIQNEFIDHTLCISRRCGSVSYLKRSESVSAVPCVKLINITKMQLVNLNSVWERIDEDEQGEVFEWDKIIQANSQSETTYGQGQKIWYDFQAVERLLASKLVPGKVFIICNFQELPKIVFIDELYKNYVSLSNDVKIKVKQMPLSQELVASINKKHKEHRTMCTELITQVGMIMTLLNKTGGEPESRLVDYVNEMKDVMTKNFSEDLLPSSSSVLLGHIIALYEVLEELNADSIKDALNDEFRTKIDLDHETMIKAVVGSKMKLGTCILQACKRFITRCLSIQDMDLKKPLIEYLADKSFWAEGVCDGRCLKTEDGETELIKFFPEQVMVEHTISLVTVLEKELEKIREESSVMSKIAQSWQSSNGNIPSAKDRRRNNILAKQTKEFAF